MFGQKVKHKRMKYWKGDDVQGLVGEEWNTVGAWRRVGEVAEDVVTKEADLVEMNDQPQ